MKILCVIPHYFRPKSASETKENNSSNINRKEERISVLGNTISSIHQLYGSRSAGLDHWRGIAWQVASPHRCEVDILICTSGEDHLLTELPVSHSLYRHARIRTVLPPTHLGFAAHALMREHAGRYDWYGYIEDDIVMVDPLFFKKRALFDERFGPDALLQPNRFETDPRSGFKVYPDYIVASAMTAQYQDLSIRPSLTMNFLDEDIHFERTSYPSAGSFFLNGAQLERWTSHPSFMDMDESYMGPLDSASILSIMKAFRVYKPVLDQASFLELRHGSPRWARVVGTEQTPLMPRERPFHDLPDHAHPGQEGDAVSL